MKVSFFYYCLADLLIYWFTDLLVYRPTGLLVYWFTEFAGCRFSYRRVVGKSLRTLHE